MVGGSIILLGAASFLFGRATRPYGGRRRNGSLKAGVIGGVKKGVRTAFLPLGPKLTKVLFTLGATLAAGSVSGPAAPVVMTVALPASYLAIDAVDKATKTGKRR